MSYGQMRNYVTMIDQLPELEDLAGVGSHMDPQIMERPDINDDKYRKHIRGSHMLSQQAGMESYAPAPSHPPQEQIMMPPPPPPQQKMDALSYNCIDISKHIQECPICSRFYHNDKTVYIIAIVVLSIVCLLLLKRVLNV